MRIRVLGSSGIHPTADNPASGFLIDSSKAKVWIDAGNGTFAALQAAEDYLALDAVLVTHGHADHCLDLFPLHYALLLHEDGPRRLPLYCPQETWDILTRFQGPKKTEDFDRLDRTFDFHPLTEESKVELDGLTLTFARTDHSAYTLAVRGENDTGTFVYTSDTGPGVDLAPFVEGAEFLLCEATYQNDKMGKPVHLSAEQAGDLAQRAKVGELALTHLAPGLDPVKSRDEARKAAGGISVSVARPGRVYQAVSRGG
jgi:ribonuclease BN (tRNA processing enzyme)